MSSLIRHAIIEKGVVVNVIEYETEQYGCPDGLENVVAIATDTGQIGWLYKNKKFIDPNPTPSIIPLTPTQLREAEYPPLSDYLDAVSEGDNAAEKAYKDARKAVNIKYPKGI